MIASGRSLSSRRGVLRAGALWVTCLALLAGPVSPASAHATLLFTTPAVGGGVAESPREVQLVFDQPVVASQSSISVTGAGQNAIKLGSVASGSQGQVIASPIEESLPAGEYLVQWQAAAQDGDLMIGEFRFAVGSTVGLGQPASATETRGLWAMTGFRWLMFLGLSIALGGLVGRRLADRRARERSVRNPSPWLVQGAALGLTGAMGLGLLFLGGGRLILPDGPALGTLIESTPGRVAGAEIVAFALAAGLFTLGRDRSAALALLLVPVAEAIRAHPHAAAAGWGAALTGVHLSAAAIWLGALIYVVRVGARNWRTSRLSVAGLVGDYARMALWLFLAVIATGAVAGLVLIPEGQRVEVLTDTTYGRWLLLKVGLVVVVALLALWGRASLRRRASRRQPSSSAMYEVAVLVCVVAISGLLTGLAPPARVNVALPFPPPPVGPVVAVGSRAGSIGLGITASQGQLLVRLYTPDMTAGTEPGGHPDYTLEGNVAGGRREDVARVRFQRCGTGCFVAPTRWSTGVSTVTLQATAAGFDGGTTAVSVPWPADPATGLLRSTVRKLKQLKSFTLHEQVTSNTRDGAGVRHRFTLTGREFLNAEPYGSGTAPNVVVLDRTSTETTLALAYPAEGIFVQLSIDTDGQLLRETLSAPNHLVYRTFVYPEVRAGPEHEH
jgi:copper transport protein